MFEEKGLPGVSRAAAGRRRNGRLPRALRQSGGARVFFAQAKSFATAVTNCKLVRLGAGKHNFQEDHPQAVGREIASMIRQMNTADAHV